MRLLSFVPIGLAVVLLGNTAVLAQEDDDQAKRIMEDLRAAYLKAYNAHDAEAVAALYAEDADVMYPNGELLQGRDVIEKELKETFSEHENVKLTIAPKAARFITPRVLLVDGITEITDGPPEIPSRTFHTVVFQRQRDDNWRIAAIRLAPAAEGGQ